MKIEKEYIVGIIGGLIGGALAYVGLQAISKRFDKEKKSNSIGMANEILPPNAQNIITFSMKNSTGSAQKITIFNGYSLVPIQMQNPNISISSTPSLEYFIKTLQKEPKQLDRVVVICGKSGFEGIDGYSYLAPPMPAPAPPVPAPMPAPVPPLAPAPAIPLAPPVPPPIPAVAPVIPNPDDNKCQQQIEQPFLVEYKDANGQAQSAPIFPMVGAYQKQGNRALASMKNIVLDAQTVIKDYTVMPNTTVRMIFFWKSSKKK